MALESIKPFSDYGIVSFPGAWPPAARASLFAARVDELERELVAFPDGHLALMLRSPQASHEVHFQKIKPAGAGDAVVCITWDTQAGRCYINHTALGHLHTTGAEVLEFTPNPSAASSSGPLHFTGEALDEMPRWEWLFVHTLLDLESKIGGDTPYALIRACGLIRHLILDSEPLANVVASTYGQTLKYRVVSRSEARSSPGDASAFAACTLFAHHQPTLTLDLPQFLRVTALHCGPHRFSVREVLKTAANAFGSVHRTEHISDETEEKLLALEREFQTGTVAAPLRAIREIGLVVLATLQPLARSIKAAEKS